MVIIPSLIFFMESSDGQDSFDTVNHGIETPEELCALIKNILHKAFQASYFDEDSAEKKAIENEIAESVKKTEDYYKKNYQNYSRREQDMFFQFINLPVNSGAYFVLRAIELLGPLEYRLKPSNFEVVIDHREFYARILPLLRDLINGFLSDESPQLEKFVEIGEFISAIIASDFYELGKTYYEAEVFDLHQAFREIIMIIVQYKEDLRRRAVPIMTQHRNLLNLILNHLNMGDGDIIYNA